MLRLYNEITIGGSTYTGAISVEIVSSWELFTDTAVIELATNFHNENKTIADQIKVGDAVTIELGYYPNSDIIFTGFVSKVEPTSFITIHCEDYMWKLKQITVPDYVSNSVDIKTLLESFSLPIDFEVDNKELGKVRFKSTTVTKILSKLKDSFGIISYIRDGVLVVNYTDRTDAINRKFYLNGELGNVISDNLTYLDVDLVDFNIKGVSFQSDDTTIELYANYKDGVINVVEDEPETGAFRVFNFLRLTKAELTTNLEALLPKFYYDGFTGDFTTFLRPVVRFGDTVTLYDLKLPEKNGTYKVKKVVTTFNLSGGRQIIDLDLKIN